MKFNTKLILGGLFAVLILGFLLGSIKGRHDAIYSARLTNVTNNGYTIAYDIGGSHNYIK